MKQNTRIADHRHAGKSAADIAPPKHLRSAGRPGFGQRFLFCLGVALRAMNLWPIAGVAWRQLITASANAMQTWSNRWETNSLST